MTDLIIIIGLGLWGILAPVGGFLLAKRTHKCPPQPNYVKHPIPPPTNRGPAAILHHGFTIEGKLIGEETPPGTQPEEAAQERSRVEGRAYGAKRI